MTIEYISLEHLTAVQQAVEGLAGIDAAIYDSEGRLLIDSSGKKAVFRLLDTTEEGQHEFRSFLEETVQKAALRKDITIEKDPAGQQHFFIPCHLNGTTLVLVGGAFYYSMSEFHDFIARTTYQHRFLTQQIKDLSSQAVVMDYEKIRRVSFFVQKLFHSIVRSGHENRLYRKKYSRAKTVLRLLSHVEGDVSHQGICTLMSDVLIYLFNVDSLACFAADGDMLKTVYAAGRLKGTIDNLSLRRDSWTISKAFDQNTPFFYDNPIDFRNLGLSEAIESIYIFPVGSSAAGLHLLILFNTRLSQEDEQEVSDLCHIVNFLSDSLTARNDYSRKMKEVSSLNLATSGLKLMFEKPDVLYNSILDTAVRLSKAEKGSLMLAENGTGELSVKAVKGINKWLVQDLRIGPGEGIAGRVFRESVPVISKNIENDFSLRKRPNYKTPSFISIPLKVGEETIGVLNISDKISGEVFAEEDLAMIYHFANYASIALKGSRYYSLAEQMKELSITDSLTDLYNRRYFQDRLSEEVDRSDRHKLNFSLCIIDIDDFKLFNDTEGHPAGDDVLKRLARIINDALRAIDVLARIGGEEFAIIMPQTDKDEAYFVAERIRSAVKEKMTRTWKFYPKDNITVSIGICTFPVDGDRAKRLISNADKALYRAKMNGKDRTFTWEEKTAF